LDLGVRIKDFEIRSMFRIKSYDLGFRIEGSGHEAEGLESGSEGSGHEAEGLESGIEGSTFRAEGWS
jgi:hypothetical protein